MKSHSGFSIIIGLIVLIVSATPVFADGIIIPDPPVCRGNVCPITPFPLSQLQIKYHYVDVTIDNQIAITRVDQVFYNPSDWAIEGTYVFPLPADAVVTDFKLWIDGEPIKGKVLSSEEARKVYEEIVNKQRDPALLEYIGRGAVQASIFPIPPHGEQRIELNYSQVLSGDNGLVRYVYPLNTEKFSVIPLESVRITVRIRASTPIRAVYSPSHSLSINRLDDGMVIASYEENDVLPVSDFAIYYSLGENEAFHLLTFRDPGDPVGQDGFFLMLLAPKPGQSNQTIAKDVILVIDHSGSMEGEKFKQAQLAAKYILENLNSEDRFGLVAFSSSVENYSYQLQRAADQTQAIAWLDELSAVGSTDINRALLEAASMASGERPVYLIFLTDGLPTEGETNSQEILNNFATSAPANLRLFTFGVGDDVDTFLLDSLAGEHHGRSTYVRTGEQLDEILSGFYRGIIAPVLTDLELEFVGLSVYDIYPNPLPDLFEGSQIIISGRYRSGGKCDVVLRGMVNGEHKEFVYSDQEFMSDSRERGDEILSSIPRLWATRKIGYLLNVIRLDGPKEELISQVVKLSIRYGIVTPYTSYLVTEDLPLGDAVQEKLIEGVYQNVIDSSSAPTSGQGAVDKAAAQGELERLDNAVRIDKSASQRVRIVGSHTFVKVDNIWMDTAFNPDNMLTQKVAFLSNDYFALTQSRHEIASAFALGDRVIVVVDGVAYEVVREGEVTAPLQSTPISQTSVPPLSAPTSSAAMTTNEGNTICPAAAFPLLAAAMIFLKRKVD